MTYSDEACLLFVTSESLEPTSMPREFTAFLRICSTWSTVSFSSTITLQRLRSALLSWNEGFSVVAPINVMVPFSTCGRNVSLNMKRCIHDNYTLHTIKSRGTLWLGGSWGAHDPPPSYFVRIFLSHKKTWHGGWHDNLVSTLYLTQALAVAY